MGNTNYVNFEELYHLLFNQVTDAIGELEKYNLGLATDILKTAQQICEEKYSTAE